MNRILTFFIVFIATNLFAQEKMQVIRCTAPELQTPIQNIYVDKDNKKWVGNSKGLFQVHAIDFASEESLGAGQQSLLRLPNGNNDITWSVAQMDDVLNGEEITAAYYDTSTRELWVGTAESGVIRLKIGNNIQKVGEINNKNSKLRSNKINVINKDLDGRFWIGSEEGVLVGTLGKWKLMEKIFDIQSVSINRTNIWVMGDDVVWKIEEGDSWYPIDITERMVDGQIRDIAADSKGRVWIASEIVVRYDFEADAFQLFGPAQYFTSQDVNYIAVDRDDALWVGTQDKGLYLIEKASAITVTALVNRPLDCNFTKPNAGLQVKITGGQPPYEFKWDQGLTGQAPTGLGPGTYALTVTDDLGKSNSTKVTVPDPRFKVSVAQTQPESGTGLKDGVAEVNIEGGAFPFTYKWDSGETSKKASKLGEGNHEVTVTDKNGCTGIGSVFISQTLAPLQVAINQTSENNCKGDESAALDVKVSGGKGPFTYKWNIAKANGNAPSGLGAGNYQLTVTDLTGTTSTAQFSVGDPSSLSASIQVEAPASTGNADGRATASGNGGSGPYTYQWDTGESGATASKLGPGTRTVTVTDSKGCKATATVQISENILPLSANIRQSGNIQCNGASTAALEVSISGGKAPFKYGWNQANAKGDKPNQLGAGTYNVVVTDGTGATATASFSINEPSPLSVSVSVNAAASTGNSDGKATAKGSGGTGNYTFKWDNGETDRKALRLSPGNHSVTVTDENGCTSVASIDISENILPLSASIDQTSQVKCSGSNEAALSVEVNGGKGPFIYQWSNNLNGQSPSGVNAGQFQLTVTDATGATTTSSINVTEPDAVGASITVNAPASTGNSDGKATAKGSGGTGNYTFKWDNGETDKKALRLSPGTHTVTVTDSNGCTATANVEVSENILPLSASIDQTAQVKCNGSNEAAVSVEVNGGKGPYTYQWNNGLNGERPNGVAAGQYNLTVTDVTGTTTTASVNISEPETVSASVTVNAPASTGNSDGKATARGNGGSGNYTYRWDNGETDKKALSLSPGSHSVTITDTNGCTAVASTEISENILPLSASINQTAEVKCNGSNEAALSIEVNGGKGPYTYQWNNGLNGERPSRIAAGQYNLTVTDVVGTTASATINIVEPEAVTANITVNAPATTDNSDGQATAVGRGGSGNYTYRWDNGETSKKAVSLSPGERLVTITDSNGCTATASTNITENILPLSVSINQSSEIKCKGEQAAGIAAQVSGGKAPFSYNWSGGLSGQNPSGLGAGTYELTITDSKNSTATANIRITEPEGLSASIFVEAPASTGNSDGKASANGKGGVGNYTYRWENGETNKVAANLAPGSHSVTISDGNGCTATANTEITENILPLNVAIDQTGSVQCFNGNSGALSVKVSGGKGPFEYQWNLPVAKGNTPSNLPAGDYLLTVTDVAGQTKTARASITEPEELTAAVTALEPAADENTPNGGAKLVARGGVGNYSYNWGNGEDKVLAQKLAIGPHEAVVSDGNGCQVKVAFEIKKRIIPELQAGRLSIGQIIRLSELNFEADSTNLNETSKPILDEIYNFMEQNPTISIEIGGHTNGVPPHEYCDRLSSARAKSIADYIVEKGITTNRIAHKGYGKRKPLASNQTAAGRRRNQRVELRVLTL